MTKTFVSRPTLRTLGRKALPKRWHENCEVSCHAPASYRRDRVRAARHKENHNLANHLANDHNFKEYESLGIAKRDADWLYF